MSSYPSIPDVPGGSPEQTRFFLAIKERLEVLCGERGNARAALLSDIQQALAAADGEAAAVDLSDYARSGSNSDITQLSGLQHPLSVEQGGTGQASRLIYPGMLVPYGGDSDVDGWLLCDGRQFLTSDYPDLFSAIGHKFGGSGSLFKIPDMRGRAPVGCTSTPFGVVELVTVAGSGINGQVVGAYGGAETHTLTIGEMPSHNHPLVNAGKAIGGGVGVSGVSDAYTPDGAVIQSISNTGGGLSHNNMQPSLVVNFLIKT